VNLPARHKMAPPRYQGILNRQIPTVNLPENRGTVRVIAGEFAGSTGPAQTFTPIQVWDLHLTSDQRTMRSIELFGKEVMPAIREW
jgi:redox-sensitive bicupin YhaK (pirin superfamily)